MTEQELEQRNAVVCEWLLLLARTATPRPRLSYEVQSLLEALSDGRDWHALMKRKGSERWMLTEQVARVAVWSVSQSYRVPSMVVPMLTEFRDWALAEAARMRWEVMGLGAEEAEFLSALGHAFVEYELANDGGTQGE